MSLLTKDQSVMGRRFRIVVISVCLLLSSFISTTSWSMSRIGRADVKEINGRPCFSISEDSESRGTKIHLFSITVSETVSESWKVLPTELWSFLVDPPGQWIETVSGAYICYGDTPSSAKVRAEAKPLQQNHPYSVVIGAESVNSIIPAAGYKATFCLKPSLDGKIEVAVVLWDDKARRWRHEVCEFQRPEKP
jgi:hypothetical protein